MVIQSSTILPPRPSLRLTIISPGQVLSIWSIKCACDVQNHSLSTKVDIPILIFNLRIDPFSYSRRLIYSPLSLKVIPYFLSNWEVISTIFLASLHKSINFQLFIVARIYLFYVSHHIEPTSFSWSHLLHSCDRFHVINFAHHFQLFNFNKGIIFIFPKSLVNHIFLKRVISFDLYVIFSHCQVSMREQTY